MGNRKLRHGDVKHNGLERILGRTDSNISWGRLKAQSRLRQSAVEWELHHGGCLRCGLVR